MNSLIRVKICGLTCPEDAVSAAEAGTDAIGLVFYPPSPRYVSNLALAKDIACSVGPFVSVVGLFVNADVAYIEDCLNSVPLNVLQFHGSESEDFCRQFHRPYIKALAVKDDVNIVAAIESYSSAQGILLDTYKPGVPGGTGETFNWDKVPQGMNCPMILAGGLNPSNVAESIKQVRPYAVDVSGGVESAPGKKDADKIREFIRCAHSA